MYKAFVRHLIVAAALLSPFCAAAQGFPDSSDEHWAAEAISKLHRDGILVGYPDGPFRGNRPVSRYEIAVAISAAYFRIKSILDDYEQAELDTAKTKPGPDLAPLRDAIEQLHKELAALNRWAPDIEDLKKLAAMFEKELTQLGIDVEQMKVDFAHLQRRVGLLEARQLPVDIHGDASTFLIGGFGYENRPGITVDGRFVGAMQAGTGQGLAPIGLSQDSFIYHELALKLSGNNAQGPHWHATVVESDMLGGPSGNLAAGSQGAFPSQSSTAPLTLFAPAQESVYVEDWSVDIHKSFDLSLGRVGYSIDPYIYQRPNTNPYFQDDRWDNGLWGFDGAVAAYPVGIVKLTAFAGKQDSPVASNNVEFQPMVVGALSPRYTPGGAAGQPIGLPQSGPAYNGLGPGMPVDEQLGVNAKIALHNGNLDLAYIWFESNQGVASTGIIPNPTNPSVANRAQVFGGRAHWNSGPLSFEGGISGSNLQEGHSESIDRNNLAWHVGAGLQERGWSLGLGYRDIEPLFGAPGDWGRIGLWWNPTDIKGPQADLQVDLSHSLKLKGSAEWDSGEGSVVTTPLGTFAGLESGDHLTHYTSELGYQLNDAWQFSVGAEWVYWSLANRPSQLGNPAFLGGKPEERWYNLGIGYGLASNARLSFLYQFSDFSPGLTSEGLPVLGFGLPTRDGKATGSLITTQLTIKF